MNKFDSNYFFILFVLTRHKLYYFNPGHENALLNESPFYTPPTNIANLQHDLAYLPAWLGTREDFVYIGSPLPISFIEHLESHNILISKAITPTLLNQITKSFNAMPWGVSPQSVHFFKKIKEEYNLNLMIPECDNRLRKLSGRQTAHECLNVITANITSISSDLKSIFFTDLESVEQYVNSCDYQLLAKAPYSSSGRGLLWLPIGQLTRVERQIIHGILKKQGTVSIEKVQRRILDFAMEFSISDNKEVDFKGYSLFETSLKGNYLGNYLGSQKSIIDKLEEYISSDLLTETQECITLFLKSTFGGIYSGTIGIDMMIYLEGETYKLHPCIEINVRDNMGVLAINISEKHIHPHSKGKFYIEFESKAGAHLDLHRNMSDQYPIVSSNGKIVSGYLSLCPIYESTKYRAYILVEK